MVCKWQVEIDDYATKVLEKHWPNVRRWRDVRTWPQPDTEPVDIIAGGFPCQDISYAGRGAGLTGERSGLFYEVMRIVGDMGPRIVVLENVAALLTRGLDSVLGSLASLGFDAEWHCIPAASVGAPHIRDRAFIVAYATGVGFDEGAGLRGGDQAGSRRRHAGNSGGKIPDANGEGLAKRKRQDTSRAWADCRCQLGGSERWESEPAVGRVVDGFPDRVDQLRGLGNAVVPQVAEWIGRRIVEAIKEKASSEQDS